MVPLSLSHSPTMAVFRKIRAVKQKLALLYPVEAEAAQAIFKPPAIPDDDDDGVDDGVADGVGVVAEPEPDDDSRKNICNDDDKRRLEAD
jgi:hypothetical protein